jgi:hypothetical protein
MFGTRVLVVLLVLAALAHGYQWASRYDGPGHDADEAAATAISCA